MVAKPRLALRNRFHGGRCGGLPYDDVSFDAVACCFGLLHLPNPAQGVREAYRVLKPSGRYSVTLWNGPERGGDLFKIILRTVSTLADMNVDLPKAPPMFELSEPERIETLMRDAGFTDIQRTPIASAWRTRRAEDIVEWLKYASVRLSLIIQFQKPEVRERIMGELIKVFRPYERSTGAQKWVVIPLWRRALGLIEVTDAPNARFGLRCICSRPLLAHSDQSRRCNNFGRCWSKKKRTSGGGGAEWGRALMTRSGHSFLFRNSGIR